MINLLLIAIGGAIGSILRYLTANGVYAMVSRDFPYGTLIVNVIGSGIMGFLTILILARFSDSSGHLRSLLLVGLMGGYTTFSAFSFETFYLFLNGHFLRALLNILLSVALCLLATWLGFIMAMRLSAI